MDEKRRLYIAYGSNLNLEQMAIRCPTAKVAGATVLRNWRLVFNGVASIERSKGDKVPVLIWDIQPKDEAALDVYEGWPRLYRKETIRVTLNGKQVRAMVYVMNHTHPNPPSASYYNTILEGYLSAGFDLNILHDAVKKSKEQGGEVMDKAVIKEQVLAVRDTGRTNMLDANAVQRIAYEMELYELVNFIEDNRKAYSRFVMTGEIGEDEP